MTPEDEKRLTEIRTASSPGHPAGGASNDEVLWLLAKLDEEKWAWTEAELRATEAAKHEIANLARAHESVREESEMAARAKDELADVRRERDAFEDAKDRAEAALAEERAKREKAERDRDVHERRAEAVEAALKTEYAARGDDIKRANDELEIERAKSRAKFYDLIQQNMGQGRDRDSWRARAETAEARVRELEGIGQNTASGRMREERDHYRAKALAAEARVAELTALLSKPRTD